MRMRSRIAGASLIISILCISYSVCQIYAEWQIGQVLNELDDPTTEYLDTVDIATETLPLYRAALQRISLAVKANPLRSSYHAAAAKLYGRLALWRQTVMLMSGTQSAVNIEQSVDGKRAVTEYYEAIRRAPSVSSYHLSLGILCAALGEQDRAQAELELAVELYSINAATRYAVAMQYLMMGKTSRALQHGDALARIDDIIGMLDPDRKAWLMRNGRTQYENMLAGSYLYKAMEVVWFASGKDVGAIRSVSNVSEDAREAAILFLIRNGVDPADM